MIQDQRAFRRATRRIEWHAYGCPCARCDVEVPSKPVRLTGADFGKLTVAGVLTGTAIAFAIDAHAAAAALAATVGVVL